MTEQQVTPVRLLDATTKKEVASFDTIKDLRNATGWGASAVYRRLNEGMEQQPIIFTRDGKRTAVLITNATQILKPADPNAEYIVTDGTLVFHKGPLEECRDMIKQLGLPNLKTKLWQ